MHRTDPTVPWGILGCARIARLQFVPAIGRSTNATLHAVASRDPARLAEFRNQFGGVFTAHASYEALLADPTVDAVYVPLETPFLRAAKARGLKTVDGLGMLMHQAVPGFQKWFGVTPVVDDTLYDLVAADIAGGQK